MEATQKLYKEIQAQKMPNLICTGQISEIGETHVSKSGNYIVTEVKLVADGAGRNTSVYLCVRPEWFVKGFDPSTIFDEFGKGVDFVYRTHFDNRKKTVSYLRGLIGSEEGFVQFRNNTLLDSAEEFDNNTFNAALRAAVTTSVGYVMKQDADKIVEEDEDGNAQVSYIRNENYKLDRMFYPTKEELKRQRNYAEKSNGNALFTCEVQF